METIKKLVIACLVIGLLIGSSNTVFAYGGDGERPDGAAMVVDIPIRVVSLAVTIVGVAVWFVTLPFTLFGAEGSVVQAWDGLVQEPAEFTFIRPLGQFDDWRDYEEDETE